jgi:hypothetical protein
MLSSCKTAPYHYNNTIPAKRRITKGILLRSKKRQLCPRVVRMTMMLHRRKRRRERKKLIMKMRSR